MSGEPPTEEGNGPERSDVAPPPPVLPELEELRDAAPPPPQELRDAAPPPPSAPRATASPPQEAGGPGALALPEQLAFLRNRFVLGGMALVVVLLLIAIVLIAFGGGADGPQRPLILGDSTPADQPTAQPGTPLVGRIRTTTSTRNGPGSSYAILGTIPGGALVTIIGRSEDEAWLQVIFPPGSQLRAWVDASFIEVTGDISQLTVAGPGEGPSVLVPTQVPTIATPLTATATSATAEATPTTTPAATATPPTTAPPGPTPLPTAPLPTIPPTAPPPTVPAAGTTPEGPAE